MLWISSLGTATDGDPGAGALGRAGDSALPGLGRILQFPVRKGLAGGADGTNPGNNRHKPHHTYQPF
jgi:hypothetical protein